MSAVLGEPPAGPGLPLAEPPPPLAFRLGIAREAFEIPHRQLLGDGLPGHGQRIGHTDQGTSETGGDLAVPDHLLDRRRQVEEADRVGDMRATAAHHPRDVFLGVLVVVDQALVALRLIDGGEVGALQVFDQADLQGIQIVDRADDDRHVVELGLLRRPPATFAGDDFVGVGRIAQRTHKDGL